MKVEIFQTHDPSQLQTAINKWLEKNWGKIEVKQIHQDSYVIDIAGQRAGVTIISIWYEEKGLRNA